MGPRPRGRGSKLNSGAASVSITLDQPSLAETHLAAPDVDYKYARAVVTVEHTTRCLDNLPVARPPHFWRTGATFRLLRKLPEVAEDSLAKTSCRLTDRPRPDRSRVARISLRPVQPIRPDEL